MPGRCLRPFRIALTLALVAGCGSAERDDAPTEADRIRDFVQPYVDAGYWSGSIVVARGDSVLLAAGFGSADAEHAVPNEPATRFPVASVSKAFTRLALAGLRVEGLLSDSARLSEYLPGYPRGDEITVRHLAEHHSGISDIDDLGWFPTGQSRAHELAALVDSLAKAPLDFEPGERYAYSNGGYIVLAAVLEAASGLPYDEVLRRYVFEPAGMTRSGNWAGGILPARADGYTLNAAGGLTHAPLVHPSNKIGAGSAYTTVLDVLAFHRSLRDGVLGERARSDSLFGTIDSPFGRPRVYFGGRGPGYTAAIQIYRDDDVLVAALGNNYSRLNEEITDGILGLLLEGPREARVDSILSRRLPFGTVDVPAGRLEELAGRYRHQWGFEFTLEREDGGLVYVDPEHGTRSPMIPVGDSAFVSPWQWARLEFDRSSATEAEAGAAATWRWLDFPGDDWTVSRIR